MLNKMLSFDTFAPNRIDSARQSINFPYVASLCLHSFTYLCSFIYQLLIVSFTKKHFRLNCHSLCGWKHKVKCRYIRQKNVIRWSLVYSCCTNIRIEPYIIYVLKYIEKNLLLKKGSKTVHIVFVYLRIYKFT